MSTSKLLMFGMVSGVAALVIYLWQPTSPSQGSQNWLSLTIPAGAFDIGTVWEDEHFKWTVPVRNGGVELVEICSISTSCNCLSVEPQSFHLLPGEQRELHLDMDLTSQSTQSDEVRVSIIPRVKAKGAKDLQRGDEFEWAVKGRVRRALKFDTRVYVGQCSASSQELPVWNIPFESLVRLKSLSAKCDSTGFSTTVSLPLEEGKAFLQIKRTLPLRVEGFEGTVTLKPVLLGGKAIPERHMKFHGKIVPDIEAVPPILQVGGRRLGEVFEDVIVLRSITGQSFTDVRCEPHGQGLSVTAIGDHWRVSQTVCQPGLQTNQVQFFAQSACGPVKVIVPIRYTGLGES